MRIKEALKAYQVGCFRAALESAQERLGRVLSSQELAGATFFFEAGYFAAQKEGEAFQEALARVTKQN